MKVLVTGSSGHLGEALIYILKSLHYDVIGLDILPSPSTSHCGSVSDPDFVKHCMNGVKTVFHTATLHKPHVATHSEQAFIDTNITGTLTLLQAAVAAGVEQFVFTSTTSVFGDALIPPAGAPAAWITEDVVPVPKNIYGATKTAAEDLCQLYYRNYGLPCIVLRTSRFFPEQDDVKNMRDAYPDDNLKANEYLYRRVEIEDVVNAHILAASRAPRLGFGKYIISATTPFHFEDMADLRTNAPGVLQRLFPDYEADYQRYGWKMLPGIDRVYVNERARRDLGWEPRYDFRYVLDTLKKGQDLQSPLAKMIGIKGYHAGKLLGY